MKVKQAMGPGSMGRLRDRFNEFHAPKTLGEQFEMVSRVKGIDGVEVPFAAPYKDEDIKNLKGYLSKYQLGVSAVNVNIKKDPVFVNGAVSSYSKKAREQAIDFLKRGMDLASELKADRIHCCPLNDGYDYFFQVDYRRAWDYTVSSFRKAAQHNRDMIISIEYKPCESRVKCIVDTAAKTLLLCQAVEEPNMGITIDVGHSLIAGETPAETLCLVAASPWPYYVHINDSNGKWDWDLIAGTMGFWNYLEFIFYLKELDYQGWISSDMAPMRLDPIEAFARNAETTNRMIKLTERLNTKKLFDMMEQEQTIEIMKYLEDETWGKAVAIS